SPAESSSLAYGRLVHLPLLSTSPRGDAVTISYRPEWAYLKRTCTSLAKHAYRRTGTGFQPVGKNTTGKMPVPLTPRSSGTGFQPMSKNTTGKMPVPRSPTHPACLVPARSTVRRAAICEAIRLDPLLEVFDPQFQVDVVHDLYPSEQDVARR